MKSLAKLFIITAAVFVSAFYLGACALEISFANGGNSNDDTPVIQSGSLSIHFLELGTKYTGDSVYIKYGETDILIDAGSKNNANTTSVTTIRAYLDRYVEDNRLEYVIATHAHEDHIAAFYDTPNVAGNAGKGILSAYEIGTIIDFPKTNSTVNPNAPTTSTVLGKYYIARNNAIAGGAEHYSALECYNNIGNAQRVYELDEDVSLEILYNYYYDHSYASNENNYSVCVQIVQGSDKYLFTGDLEKSGEDRLADSGQLDECVLWKGGHHGSKTSGNVKLLGVIKPQYVCICTCAGSSEYTDTSANQFPTQDFIDRIAPYTDCVYITTLVTNYSAGGFTSMNGNIVFTGVGSQFTVVCSNNNTKLKDTAWFAGNRICPDAWVT